MAKIRWNLPAFEEIRRLPGVDDELRSFVDDALDKAGRDKYDGGVEPGRSRSRGYIVTKNLDGIIDHRRNHTLIRVIGGGQS